jgi:predicted phosphoribosyltransferase
MLGIPDPTLEAVTAAETAELERRERAYRGEAPPFEVAGRQVILIDDGVATGATLRAALAALRRLDPARVIVAVPTAPPDTCEALRAVADELVVLDTPEPFLAVGRWYRDFGQTSDEEVRSLLARARRARQEACKP